MTTGMAALAADFFTFVLELQNGEIEPNESLWHDAKARIRAFMQQAQAANYRQDMIDNCGLAMAALIDQVVQTSNWPARTAWSEPLADKLFREVNAGESFYTRLDRLVAPELDAVTTDTVEVFATALCLGFRGGRGPDNEDAINRLFRRAKGPQDEDAMRDLIAMLNERVSEARGGNDRLSPNSVASKGTTIQIRRVPSWWIVTGTIAVIALVAIFLEFQQSSRWEATLETLNSAEGR